MALTKTAIEPILPEQRLTPLENSACIVLEKAAKLSEKVREPLRSEIVEITRWMHCYYSNLIEGQNTQVRDIESALKKDFSENHDKRNLQKLALAHLSVQRWAVGFDKSPFTPEFFCELHRRFYAELPKEMCVAKTSSGEPVPLEPGVLRTKDVDVGNHIGPPFEIVPGLLDHFQNRYDSPEFSRLHKIIAIAASHHRLAWIHPFRDGNGRVVRLFSDTLIRWLGIDGGGLWSLSRGFAFHRKDYYALLANADQERSSSSSADGRGHLSERALYEFCEFVLQVMIDQIDFTLRTLEIDTIAERIERYVGTQERFGKDSQLVFLLLREALYRGEFPRGDSARIIGKGERTSREILSKALKSELLKSDTPKSAVRLALPAKVLGDYFPSLFPVGQLEP